MQQEMLGFTPEKLLINAVPTEKLPEVRELLKDEEVIISQWCNGSYISHNTVKYVFCGIVSLIQHPLTVHNVYLSSLKF